MALRNVGRNWNRTGMIILSMMVASAMMTLTLAVSSGYAAGVDLPWRQLMGADILIYPDRFVFSGAVTAETSWQWRRISPDQPTDALFFHPGLAAGYLSPSGASPAFFDLRTLPASITGVEGVAGVAPARLLGAFLVTENRDGTTTRRPVTLRGRDMAADTGQYGIPDTVRGGRYFRPAQDGEWVALVNGPGLGVVAPKVGGPLVLEVPTVRGHGPDGAPILDYTRPRTFYFLVYGETRLSLGTVRLRIDLPAAQAANYERAGPAPAWPVFVDTPEVWVPSGTFDKIYQEVAGEPLRYAGQLCVRTTDFFLAKRVAAELTSLLPKNTVLTVPQEVSLSGIRYVASLTNLEPMTVTVARTYNERSTVALDVKTELALVAFVAAGLLIVANMYILVAQRRREIGILKAIGAAGRDVLVLFLVETLGYALAGSLLGFGIIRLLTLLSLFSSPASLIEGAFLTLKALGAVAGLTVAIAVVFGFLPAWEAARTPSATLLGDS